MAKRCANRVRMHFDKHPQAKGDGIRVKHLHALLDARVEIAVAASEEVATTIPDQLWSLLRNPFHLLFRIP